MKLLGIGSTFEFRGDIYRVLSITSHSMNLEYNAGRRMMFRDEYEIYLSRGEVSNVTV